jgi:integrase/recombinase XerD
MAQTRTVTPLRQRMLDDMRLRNLAAGTRRSYVRSVAEFSAFTWSPAASRRPASARA